MSDKARTRHSTPDVIGYINSGGRGTRLEAIFEPDPETGIAKALLEIGSPSVKLIDHHIANLRQQNIDRVIVAAGDQAEVHDYIRDQYTNDAEVLVTHSAHQLGNGGDLTNYARESDTKVPLLIQNVDTILDIDLLEFTKDFKRNCEMGSIATIALTLNQGVPNEGAFTVNQHSQVILSTEFSTDTYVPASATWYRASSTGAIIIDPAFIKSQPWQTRDGQLSLYKDSLRQVWEKGGLHAYNNRNRFFRDVGTVSTWLGSLEDPELQSLLRYNNTDFHQ